LSCLRLKNVNLDEIHYQCSLVDERACDRETALDTRSSCPLDEAMVRSSVKYSGLGLNPNFRSYSLNDTPESILTSLIRPVLCYLNARRDYTAFVESKQEAQLSQTDRAMLRVIEYFPKSTKMTPLSATVSPCSIVTMYVSHTVSETFSIK